MWWVTDYLEHAGKVYLLSHVLWVIASIVLHELGHAWMAVRSGDRTPQATGHMTLNPVVHMGVQGLVLFALCGIAFGATPVNPRNFRGRYDEAKVSFAGPAVNLLLALLCAVLQAIWIGLHPDGGSHVAGNIAIFLQLGLELNVVLFLLNLLPIPPLDGGHILATFVPEVRRWFSDPRNGMIFMILFLVVFFRLSSQIWDVARTVSDRMVETFLRLFFHS